MQHETLDKVTLKKASKTDRYQGHDYYDINGLLNEEHLIAQQATREWVKKDILLIVTILMPPKNQLLKIHIIPIIEL